MKTAPLFDELIKTNKYLAPLLGYECPKHYKFVICQGGGDSAKTVSIEQMLFLAGSLEPNSKILIAADSVPNLKDGAINAYEKYIYDDLAYHIQQYRSTDKTVLYHNKSSVKFKSFEHEKNARGAEWDYAFLNEANLFDYELFWQISRKTRKQVFIDYNPVAKFWAHTNIIEGGEKQYQGKWIRFVVDHRHNPFLSQEDHDSYESISDPELFKVYARGMTGKVTGLIFGHFQRIVEMPTNCDRYIWGIDYGYTNDPTAIVKVGIKGRNRYIQECCYASAKDSNFHEYLNGLVSRDFQVQTMGAEHIKQVFINNGWVPGQPIYSEIDNEMILQLRKQRLPVAQARKGPGSVVAGISKMKEFNCYYVGQNFHDEVIGWKYVSAKDILTGKEILTNIPMDGNDHLCQASIYACYTDSLVNRNNIV